MPKMDSASANLLKPYVIGKNTTNTGIVHEIDGTGKNGPQYTTNDINSLPDSAISAYRSSATGRVTGDGYLSGV